MSVSKEGVAVYRSVRFSQDQAQLFPEAVRDLVPDGDFSRAVAQAVREMDLGELEAVGQGGVSYDPRTLLSVWLFALADGERSSRRIEKRCRFDARYRLLTGGLAPDHNTLARFRRRSGPFLPELLAQTVRLAKSKGLVKNREVAVDGTKISSAASQWKRALDESESADRDISDPDARTMLEPRGGFVLGYNAQAGLDMETGIVVAAQVSNQANDAPHLAPMVDQMSDTAGGPPERLAADTGYDTAKNAQALHERGVQGCIPGRKNVWSLDGSGRVVCPQGHPARFRCLNKTSSGEFLQFAVRACSTCPQRCHAGRMKTLKVSVGTDPAVWIAQRERAKTPEGRRMMRRRGSTVEPLFGHLKQVLGLRRFLLRGLEGVNIEFTLACIAHNLKKTAGAIWRALRTAFALLAKHQPKQWAWTTRIWAKNHSPTALRMQISNYQ